MSTDLIRRVDRVEIESFISLYGAAEGLETGWHTEDGVTAVWSGQDPDPSFSCVLDLARSPHPESTLSKLEKIACTGGGRVFGVDTHPDLETWAIDARLTGLGFQPDSEECIWARSLTDTPQVQELPPGVRIEPVTSVDRDAFVRILNIGWGLAEDAARGHIFAAGIGLQHWYQYLAYVDGEPAGVSVLFIHDQVADCFLSATLPAFRGRGVQTALIRRRLADAIALGCNLATSQTVVDNASPRNMARQGFQPLYRRWIYGKPLRG